MWVTGEPLSCILESNVRHINYTSIKKAMSGKHDLYIWWSPSYFFSVRLLLHLKSWDSIELTLKRLLGGRCFANKSAISFVLTITVRSMYYHYSLNIRKKDTEQLNNCLRVSKWPCQNSTHVCLMPKLGFYEPGPQFFPSIDSGIVFILGICFCHSLKNLNQMTFDIISSSKYLGTYTEIIK